MGRLRELIVPLPSIDLQQAFAERVSDVRALEELQAASRKRVEALNAALLARAFRGEL
ncbi:MAG: hypothetical protein ACYDCQ_13510 [Dehalococcoidia bacterium]